MSLCLNLLDSHWWVNNIRIEPPRAGYAVLHEVTIGRNSRRALRRMPVGGPQGRRDHSSKDVAAARVQFRRPEISSGSVDIDEFRHPRRHIYVMGKRVRTHDNPVT